MESKFVRIVFLAVSAVGVLLVLAGFFITPNFLSGHFNSIDILTKEGIKEVQRFKLSAISIGVLLAVYSVLGLYGITWVKRIFYFISGLESRFQPRYIYLSFCFVCFFIALTIGLLITQSGPGISADSVHYISTGENLFNGNGFQDSVGGNHPWTSAPPLYPLSIAAFMYLGFDAEQAARMVPVLSFALLMFPLFYIGKITNSVITGYSICLICIVFYPLLFITSYAWYWMLYGFFSVTAAFFLVKLSIDSKSTNRVLCLSGFFTALAILTGFMGISLLLTGLLVIVLKNKAQLRNMVNQLLIYGSISSIPIIPWLVRNLMLSNNLSGSNWSESSVGLLTPINQAVTVIVVNLLGPIPLFGGLISKMGIWTVLVILGTCLILLATFVHKQSIDKKAWAKYLKGNYVVFTCAFTYLIVLVIVRSIWFTQVIENRLVSPSYPFLILSAFSFIFYSYRNIADTPLKSLLQVVIIISCISFFSYHVNTALSFYQSAKDGQQLSAPGWKNSQMVAWAAVNIPNNSIIYSDMYGLVYLEFRRPVFHLPISSDKEAMDRFLQQLTGEENIYIISFKNTMYHTVLSHSQIIEMNQRYRLLEIAAEFPEGTIWRRHNY